MTQTAPPSVPGNDPAGGGVLSISRKARAMTVLKWFGTYLVYRVQVAALHLLERWGRRAG